MRHQEWAQARQRSQLAAMVALTCAAFLCVCLVLLAPLGIGLVDRDPVRLGSALLADLLLLDFIRRPRFPRDGRVFWAELGLLVTALGVSVARLSGAALAWCFCLTGCALAAYTRPEPDASPGVLIVVDDLNAHADLVFWAVQHLRQAGWAVSVVSARARPLGLEVRPAIKQKLTPGSPRW